MTTCAGAVVCTDGETTLNGVGSTKFSLPENTGTWEVTATPERPHGQRRGGGHRRHAVQRGSGDYLQRGSHPRTHENRLQRGGNIRLTGLVVTATYADGTAEDVTDGCTFSPTVMAASTTAVTIKYQRAGVTVTTTQAVTVLEMSSISVKTAPNKTAYYIGESFDATGMVIEATMSNGTKRP